MKYIYAAVVAIFATTGYGYETLVPVTTGVIAVQPQPVLVQTMVYYAPYYTVTVPVPVPVVVAQPVQNTYYWGYPYQAVPVNPYWYRHRCRLFNFNY